MRGGAYPKKTLDGAGKLRDVARVCYDSCVKIVYRAHCWQACARFLFGWTLARWVNFNLQDLRGCGRVLWVPKNLKPVFGLFDCADSEHGFTEASQLRGAV